MDLHRPIHRQDIQNIFEYLTKKWWLPVVLVIVFFINATVVSGLLATLLGGSSAVVLIVGLFNGTLYFASIFLMLQAGIYQQRKGIHILAWFNIVLSMVILFGVGLLGVAIT